MLTVDESKEHTHAFDVMDQTNKTENGKVGRFIMSSWEFPESYAMDVQLIPVSSCPVLFLSAVSHD